MSRDLVILSAPFSTWVARALQYELSRTAVELALRKAEARGLFSAGAAAQELLDARAEAMEKT